MAPRATRRSTAAATTAAKKSTRSTGKKSNNANADTDASAEPSSLSSVVDGNATAPPPPPTHADPKVFILPAHDPGASLTIITLPHPSTQSPTRYLLHSTTGIHEIKKISYPLSEPRSWLVVPSSSITITDEQLPQTNTWVGQGQVVPDSSVYFCTPLDPLFLILHHLTLKTTSKNYLPIDDLLEPLLDDTTFHWSKALHPGSKSEELIKSRIRAVCDSVDAGGEQSYKVNMTKLLDLLAKKCKRMARSRGGLPRTIEEEFVRKVLAKPIGAATTATITTTTTTTTTTTATTTTAITTNETKPAPEEGKPEEEEAQTTDKIEEPPSQPTQSNPTITDQTPTESLSALTISSSPTTSSAPPAEITHLQRLRVSTTYLSTYLPPSLLPLLTTHLNTLHNFTPLETYLSDLAKIKSDLTFSRAGDYSMKKSIEDEEGAVESKRKRKREEEEEEKKKKKNLSSGVKALKKVDTKGMMKMTAFFKKKE